jgi:hypothetical protein
VMQGVFHDVGVFRGHLGIVLRIPKSRRQFHLPRLAVDSPILARSELSMYMFEE